MNSNSKKAVKPGYIKHFFLASLTLGLAPWGISGEPHIIGKIRWIWGVAVGMQPLDWFDFVLHGAPWALLIGAILWEGKKKFFPAAK